MKKPREKSPRPETPNAAYYARIWRKARSYKVDMASKRWCDLWHRHFDWDGAGNESWRDRRRHLSVLLHAFRRAQAELMGFHGDHQVFALVTPSDSASDAVYVHTPNPNGTPFPMVPFGKRILTLPPLLAGRIDMARYQVFRSSGEPDTYTIMRAEADDHALRTGP
jgi:hypothetical protein